MFNFQMFERFFFLETIASTHILSIAIQNTDNMTDDQLTKAFGAICWHRKEDLLKHGIRRVTFLALNKQKFPKIFTYRARDIYEEDRIYRNLEPASAFQLELNRMRSYDLEALSTTKQKMHVYLGTAKAKKLPQIADNRIFIRSIIRHSDLMTKVYRRDF